jgi:uncharacterized protein DUF4345
MFQTRAAQTCLAVAAIAFLMVGIGHLVVPLTMVEPMNIQLRGINAFNEIRANYGGMHSLMGIFFLLGAFVTKLREAALITLAIFTSGLVLGRMVSIAVDGVPGTFIWLLLVGELIIAITAWLLLWRGAAASSRHD